MRVIVTIGLLGLVFRLQAQEEINLSELRTPSAPAFTILGIQPNEISQPKAWQEFEASVFTDAIAQNKSLALPTDYALEITPFWMTAHPNLTFDELTTPGTKSLLHNLSFSLATQNGSGDSLATNLGLGVRTVWDFGKPTKELALVSKRVDHIQSAITLFNRMAFTLISSSTSQDLAAKADAIISGLNTQDPVEMNVITSLVKLKETLAGYPSLNAEVIIRAKDEIVKTLSKDFDLGASAKKLQDMITYRQGFKVEFAFAGKIGYPTNQMADGRFVKYGVWLTPSFQHKNLPNVEFLGMLRMIRNNQDISTDIAKFEELGFTTDYTINRDLGGKLILKQEKFSFSTEMIFRNQQIQFERIEDEGIRTNTSSSSEDFKWNLSLSYRVSDQVLVNYTYGHNFDINTEFDGNLISVFSLNFGLGKPKLSELKGQ